MPYYVYAIHTDHTNNRLYRKFDDYMRAEKEEREMRGECSRHENYFVKMFQAKDDLEAEARADAMRRYPKLKSTS